MENNHNHNHNNIPMVGVILDTLQQIETHLLMRQYDGLMKGGKIQGRQTVSSSAI